MTRYREDVLEARMKWVKFLQKPGRKKATGNLDDGGGERCCLGHGCFVMGIARSRCVTDGGFKYDGEDQTAPESFIGLVGLHSEDGELTNGSSSLVLMNDGPDMTPQEIGAWIEARITGEEPDSPFKPLSGYPSRTQAEGAA